MKKKTIPLLVDKQKGMYRDENKRDIGMGKKSCGKN